jgi:uncharacterized protein DUF4349
MNVMRQTFTGLGFVLVATALPSLAGCGGALRADAKLGMAEAPPSVTAAGAAPEPSRESVPDERVQSPTMSAAPAAMPALGAPGVPGLAGDSLPPAAVAGAATAPKREMLDIEANITLQVPKVKRAVKALHDLATRLGGVITEERVDSSSEYGTGQLTLRVPSSATQSVFDELEKFGNVLDQNVTARDIGKEYFDANLRLSSLEATLRRYEEILTHAVKVEEILRIEQELGRIRSEMEQVKGNLRWLSDRAARATLHLSLREQVPKIAAPSLEPEPKFFPGLRLPVLIDFGKTSNQSYVGGGIALRFTRAVSLDLDLFKRSDSDARGPDAILATVGGEIYSNLLGGGERSYLNPYLGWRAGYARFDSDSQALIGATLGLELYKNRWFGLDVEARNHLAFLGPRGAHYLFTPALAARIAF